MIFIVRLFPPERRDHFGTSWTATDWTVFHLMERDLSMLYFKHFLCNTILRKYCMGKLLWYTEQCEIVLNFRVLTLHFTVKFRFYENVHSIYILLIYSILTQSINQSNEYRMNMKNKYSHCVAVQPVQCEVCSDCSILIIQNLDKK